MNLLLLSSRKRITPPDRLPMMDRKIAVRVFNPIAFWGEFAQPRAASRRNDLLPGASFLFFFIRGVCGSTLLPKRTRMRAVLTTAAASHQGRLWRLVPAAVAATATSISASPPFSLRAPGALGSVRYASSPSNSQWKQRQGRDPYTREARVQSFKSRAAFKLLEVGLSRVFTRRVGPNRQ